MHPDLVTSPPYNNKETEYTKHLSSLSKIYSSNCITMTNAKTDQGIENIKSFISVKKNHNEFLKKHKKTALERQNEVMFEKLRSISSGNYVSVLPKQQPFYKKSLLADRRRLEEIKRIQENQKMHSRIHKATSVPYIKREHILFKQNQ